MFVQVKPQQPVRIAMVRHYGPYDQIGGVFDRLWQWVTANGVPSQRTIGIYWDNPDYVPASRLRSAACVELTADYQIPPSGDLGVEEGSLAGGDYATTRFVGPYDGLAPVWSDFTAYIEGTLRRRISDNPAFEVYVNDPSDTPPDRLITDLYMPLI